ncbi:MAG TPA: hypothetical protein VGI39_06070 [Polyangiaceae bacterium]
MKAFELAPAAVARIAGWPVEALSRLASSRVAELAAGDDEAEYQAAYAEAIEEERQHLWRTTAADPRFVCAVAVVSPSLASRLDRPLSLKRNKRARHLESSLYR